jgi:hypothetical protein
MVRAAADYVMERGARPGARAVGDKSPSSTIHQQSVIDLHTFFPDASLIYLVRDGRDVAASERFRNFVEGSRFLSMEDRRILRDLRANPAAFGSLGRSIFSASMLRRVARGWATDVREIDREARRLLRSRYITVRYEDLLADSVREMRRIWTFLGSARMPRSIRASIFRELSANPDEEWQHRRDRGLASLLAKGRSGNWRSLYTPRDREIFKAEAGTVLVDWGYERSSDW